MKGLSSYCIKGQKIKIVKQNRIEKLIVSSKNMASPLGNVSLPLILDYLYGNKKIVLFLPAVLPYLNFPGAPKMFPHYQEMN